MRWRPVARGMAVALLGLMATSWTGGRVPAATAFFQKDFAEMGQVPNTSDGICSAAADINSFVYLWNHYPGVYGNTDLLPDWDDDGTLTPSDHEASRDKLAYGWGYDGTWRSGIYGGANSGTARAIWENTLYWFEDFAPGTTVFDGQIKFSGVSTWHGGDVLDMTYPTFSFLWDALVASKDIELGLLPNVSGSIGHAVTLAGMAFDDLNGDGRWDSDETVEQIGFVDPNQVDQMTWADVRSGTQGRIEFTWWQNEQSYYVYRAFTEGPLVPEPSTAVSLLVLLLLGFGWLRRRQR